MVHLDYKQNLRKNCAIVYKPLREFFNLAYYVWFPGFVFCPYRIIYLVYYDVLF